MPIEKGPYFLGGKEYSTKEAIKTECRKITATAMEYELLNDDTSSFVSDLFERHPEYKEKSGSGIKGFYVQTDTFTRKSRHFVVVRTDGTSIDFSWKICVDGKLPSRRADVLFAMRNAIADQVLKLRDQVFAAQSEIICPLSGKIVTKFTSHIDHIHPPFIELASSWVNGDFEKVKLSKREDGYGWKMSDATQTSDWKTFHQAHAVLRVVANDCDHR